MEILNQDNTELDALKNKYGVVYSLTVPILDEKTEEVKETVTIHLRKMDRQIYSQVQKRVAAGDGLTASEIMLKSLAVGDDGKEKAEKIVSNLDALRAAEFKLLEMYLPKVTAEIKKN